MMPKQLLAILLIAGLVSCKKSDDPIVPPAPIAAKTSYNVSYGNNAQQVMDIYLPAGRNIDSTKVIVIIHGGAWTEGDKSEYNSLVFKLQGRFPTYAIVNLNYRLASAMGNYFPTQENDVKAAIDMLMQKRSEYLISEDFVLFGASAGAHLALLQAYKQTIPKVKVVVDLFGPTDMTALYNSITDPTVQIGMQFLMGGTPAANPQLYFSSSPINYVTPQTPPTIIFHGDLDAVVPLAQSIALKDKLDAEGVPHELKIYTQLGHDYWPETAMNTMLQQSKDFILQHID